MIHTVQPGFNAKGNHTNSFRSLTTAADMSIFDEATQEVLKKKEPFTLRLSPQFSSEELSRQFQSMPCVGLSSIEQLKFLQDHGLTTIELDKNHPNLEENARSLGIKTYVQGTQTQTAGSAS